MFFLMPNQQCHSTVKANNCRTKARLNKNQVTAWMWCTLHAQDMLSLQEIFTTNELGFPHAPVSIMAFLTGFCRQT